MLYTFPLAMARDRFFLDPFEGTAVDEDHSFYEKAYRYNRNAHFGLLYAPFLAKIPAPTEDPSIARHPILESHHATAYSLWWG